jgi:DNA mismatch repair ATPase MutS
VFSAVSSTQGAFLRYGKMLALLEEVDLPAELLRSMQRRLRASRIRPSKAMHEFRNRVGWFDLRHNGLIHPFANALLLWDVHCILGLEAWQTQAGRAARDWFRVLGEFEALSSIAGLAHDEPAFAFPEVVGEPTCYEAEALGHPLLSSHVRVANDVTLAEAGSILLVTGSNMSGKSTLLRSMGLAAVMALAGAPVCAARLKMSSCEVRTSIRVRDSLEQGESSFYAELRKLSAVLADTAGRVPVFFLLDEILHGTNSRERQIGARWLLSELMERGAMGAASTHDMGLTRLPDRLADRVELWHFRENVHEGKMAFDYRLRPGPVTAGNALRLMRSVGLDVPLE